ncbi:MAG: DUF4097 family beta strand repeat protein [Proteobacteria bacterium]|nr:DUF4097 family beta strand repeat protein [Pseudomonadota bacterium]
MKRTLIAIVAGLIIAPALAKDVDRTVDASPNGHIDISNIAGSVTVSGWSRNTVEVTGTLDRNVKELIVERDGDTVTIKVKVPRNSGRGIDSRLHINVPQNSSLDIGTVIADIDVTEVGGEQELHTVSGDVNVEYTGADMQVESVSGDIEVIGDGVDGELEVSTVSGNVTLIRVSGRVSADSVSGDIVFRAALGEGGKLSIETVTGDVDVDFIGAVSARFEVDTFNGRIRNCFGPKAERTSKYAPGWELKFIEGEGSGRVEISTVNGDVNICRK